MGLYKILKSTYKAVLPASVRTTLWQNPVTRAPREWLLRLVERTARHEEIYDGQYYADTVDPAAANSAPEMVGSLVDAIGPSKIIDVGCGTGQLLVQFLKFGIAARGLEYSEAAIAICKARSLNVQQYNIETDPPLDWRADLVVSTEVAEHLPERCADRYVDLLTGMADVVFITAAPPGQTGTDHVNEQPNSYWIEKFASRNFEFDETLSHNWRAAWVGKGVADFYCSSAMLFRKRKPN